MKPGRGHDDLVDAFVPVVGRLPEARLVVVGRGEGEEGARVRVPTAAFSAVMFAGYRTGQSSRRRTARST